MKPRTPAIGNSELISRVNSRLVLQTVRATQPTYRAEVARRTHLRPATVTGIVNDLLDQSLLLETPITGEVGPRGGRPPQMLRVNGRAGLILAIDLEPDVIRVALTDLLVDVLDFREQPIDRFSSPAAICSQIHAACEDLLGDLDRTRIMGGGVSLPGLIDRANGVLLSSTNMPEWRNVPMRKILEKAMGLSFRVDRSVHLAALHEKWSDPSTENLTKLVISIRTGIGMSVMHQGDIYTSPSGFDGEIGHTIVDVNGRACECGSRGCLETFVSASAVCERARRLLDSGRAQPLRELLSGGEPLRPELIYRLAKSGDPDCAEIVRDVGKYIGIAVANLINLFAPNEVVVCGSIDTADELILEAVRDQISQSALPRLREQVNLRLAHAKEKAALLGAAVMVAQEVFELPKLTLDMLSA